MNKTTKLLLALPLCCALIVVLQVLLPNINLNPIPQAWGILSLDTRSIIRIIFIAGLVKVMLKIFR